MKTLLTIIPLWVITCCSAFAEDDVDRKDIKAISSFRTSVAPKLDGVLTDECWRNAPVASSFITNSPVFGNNASQTTEARICTRTMPFTFLTTTPNHKKLFVGCAAATK